MIETSQKKKKTTITANYFDETTNSLICSSSVTIQFKEISNAKLMEIRRTSKNNFIIVKYNNKIFFANNPENVYLKTLTENHKCSSCKNAYVGKCKKIADLDSQIEQYSFITNGIETRSTIRKENEIFFVEQCLNHIIINDKEQKKLSINEKKELTEAVYSCLYDGTFERIKIE